MPRSRPASAPPRRFVFGLLAVLVLASGLLAYPKPARVPYRWQLEFESGDLRLYVDDVTGAAYWYFTYQVTNRTGRDQLWAPRFTLFTDAGEIMVSGNGVPVRITRDILDLLGNELLQNQNESIGDLLQGPEHAREGLVIWPARDVSVNELNLFIRGISGETARVNNPLSGEVVVLYKTLHREYLIPGDALSRGSTPIDLVPQEEWILR